MRALAGGGHWPRRSLPTCKSAAQPRCLWSRVEGGEPGYTHPHRAVEKHLQLLQCENSPIKQARGKYETPKPGFFSPLSRFYARNQKRSSQRQVQSGFLYCYEARMSSAGDSGSKCSSGPISSFTIQSILGTPSDAPRSGTKEISKAPPPPPRRRSLSVSSEEECSGGEDSADCFCSDTGHGEPCAQQQARHFARLGEEYRQTFVN